MQGPIVDLVLLMLLILFFGLQQWRRPQIYFRFWFAGWVFVFLSYAAWAMQGRLESPVALQNAISFDFLLLGVLTFLMSQVVKENGLQRVIVSGLAMAAEFAARNNFRVSAWSNTINSVTSSRWQSGLPISPARRTVLAGRGANSFACSISLVRSIMASLLSCLF